MWCHLCTQDYPDFEDFRIHIMEKHRNASNFCKDNSDSESVHENAETCEIDDGNAVLNMSEGNCYESDLNISIEFNSDASIDGNDDSVALSTSHGKYRNTATEFKSDDSMDSDDNTMLGKSNNKGHILTTKNKSNLSKAALNILPGSYRNIEAEIKSDDSMDAEDNTNLDHTIATKNKSNLNKAALNILPGSYRNIDTEIKSDDSMDAEDNTVLGKYRNSDHIIATKNKSNLSKTALNNLPGESHDNEAGTSVINNTMLKKRKQRCNKENKSAIKETTLNKPQKKLNAPSILKKRGKKKQIKVSFGKKALPKRKTSTFSYQKEIPKDSDGYSEGSLNGDNKVNTQSVPNNLTNPAPTIPVNNYPQSVSNNNPVYIYNPYSGQNMNNYVLGNQAVQPPVYVMNTVAAKPTTSDTQKCFDFHSENILKWLTKHKELCKNIEYPLPSSLFNRVKAVHKGIFDHYCIASISEETSAVLKVYEELDCMIHKHINSINNALSVS